jgi:hypothetical protein
MFSRQLQYVPPLDGQDAVKIRTRFLFFDSQFIAKPKSPNQFPADDEFLNKLKTEYLSEVFSWFAQGAHEYYQPRQLKCLFHPQVSRRCCSDGALLAQIPS